MITVRVSHQQQPPTTTPALKDKLPGSPDRKRQRRLDPNTTTTTTTTFAYAVPVSAVNKQLTLPIDCWSHVLIYLSTYQVGSIVHECPTFFQAGVYRLQTPLQVPGDAPNLSEAIRQVRLLRQLPQPIRITKISLGPGNHTLPNVDRKGGTPDGPILVVDIDDLEISGSLVAESAAAKAQAQAQAKAAGTPVPSFQDLLLQSKPNDGPLQTHVRGPMIVAGGAVNVVLRHLDLSCTTDTALLLRGQSSLKMTQCHVHHCGSHGIAASDESRLEVDQCVIADNNDDAIKAEGVKTTVEVKSSHFLNNYDGVWCRKNASIHLTSTWVFNNEATGLRVEKQGSITHHQCHVFNNPRSNVDVVDESCTLVGVNLGLPDNQKLTSVLNL